MRVKICGITNLEDALAACDAGADALGFVFALEAKARNRYIEPDAARLIVEKLPPLVATVAVCVNEPVQRLFEYLSFCDKVQLCGEEDPEQVRALPRSRVIKVFHAVGSITKDDVTGYPASSYLLDAGAPGAHGAHGGTGACCDWQAARRLTEAGLQVILAGGLTPENVAEAVRAVKPYAVDVSGGVESAPGFKNHERVRRFIQNAKSSLS